MPRRTRSGELDVPGPDGLVGDVMSKMAGFDRRSQSADGASSEAFDFPPTVLMAGCADVTVPWHESAEFYWKLQDAAVPSRLLLYLKEDHTDFVLNWDENGSAKDHLEPYTRDLLRVLKD